MSRGNRAARREGLRVNADINVTSLIDLSFVLLTIFIITAPIMQGGIEVRLPEAQIQPLQPTQDPFTLTILEGGTVVVGETPIPAEEFETIFPQLFAAANPAEVFIRGDSLAIYGRILPVIGMVAELSRDAGIPWRLIAQERPR